MNENEIKKYLDQARNQAQQNVDDADPFRVQSYEQMERVQLAKQQVLTRQKERLAAKLGADHPRIIQIDKQITLRTQAIRGVQAERQRAATAQPAINPKDWIMHGNVKDEAGKALAGVHVLLGDASAKLIKALGESVTDRQGYFRLIVEDIEAVLKKLGNEDPAKKVFVYPQVLDEKGVVLHRSDRALQPNPGQTDFVEIIVGKGGGEIKPPPVVPKDPTKPVRTVTPVVRKPVPSEPVTPRETKESTKTTDKPAGLRKNS